MVSHDDSSDSEITAQEFNPTAFQPDLEAQSINSSDTQHSEKSTEPQLTVTRTETKKSLHDLGLTSSIPHPELNGPIIENPIFPEEYTLETTTGLVPVVTLQSIGRVKTIQEEEKLAGLDSEIEFVTFKVGDQKIHTIGQCG